MNKFGFKKERAEERHLGQAHGLIYPEGSLRVGILFTGTYPLIRLWDQSASNITKILEGNDNKFKDRGALGFFCPSSSFSSEMLLT